MSKQALLVTGTSSDAGKTVITTGIIRMLANEGISVAPFKGQNMALNSFVTEGGDEIGRAQASQAQAGYATATALMNPVLLKPTSQSSSSVLVMGQPFGEFSARDYQKTKAALVGIVDQAFEELLRSYDVVIAEGAGSPAEINLLDNDLVNLGFASRVGISSLLVGDIDRGGVFASLYGTVAILPDELSRLIKGFVINKFRGDASLLDAGISRLFSMTNIPTLGIVPFLSGLDIDSEDSLGFASLFLGASGRSLAALVVGIIHLPFISNFTDFEPLANDDQVRLVRIENASDIAFVDVVIIPGTKATVSDLTYLRENRFVEAIMDHVSLGKGLIGICGGYQMLTEKVLDGIESPSEVVEGLSIIPGMTRFESSKVLRQVQGSVVLGASGIPFSGYQIHFGRVCLDNTRNSLFAIRSSNLDSPELEYEGYVDQGIIGTTCHGIFESGQVRNLILGRLGKLVGKSYSASGDFGSVRDDYFDRCAELVESYVGKVAIHRLLSI